MKHSGLTPGNENKTLNTLIRDVNGLGILRIPFLLIIDFDLKNYYLAPLEELVESNEILIQFPGFTNILQSPSARLIDLKKGLTSFKKYQASFDKVMDHLRKGNSFLTNLTASTPIFMDGNFN